MAHSKSCQQALFNLGWRNGLNWDWIVMKENSKVWTSAKKSLKREKSSVAVSPTSRRNYAPDVSSSWQDKVSRMCPIGEVTICLVLTMESIDNEVIGCNLCSWCLTIDTSSLFRLSNSRFFIQWIAWWYIVVKQKSFKWHHGSESIHNTWLQSINNVYIVETSCILITQSITIM
jgi:hypothetical protein